MTPTETQEQEPYYLGLDLGQSQDFSALAALKPVAIAVDPNAPEAERDASPSYRYVLRGLKRWPLKTLYTKIVDDVVKLVSKPPLAGCMLGVDRTGCGQPIVDMIEDAMPLAAIKPILITAGFAVTPDGAGFHVPKRELVSTLQMLLQSRRLEIPSSIPEHKNLEKELTAFRAKITVKGNETFEADWRERAHDDEVLAVSIAAWLGERFPAFTERFEPMILTSGFQGLCGHNSTWGILDTYRRLFDQ